MENHRFAAIATKSDELRRVLIWRGFRSSCIALHRNGSGQAVGTKLGTVCWALSTTLVIFANPHQ